MTRTVTRREDMSPRGYLKVLQQDDGDIIVAVYPEENGLIQPGGSVEFCAPGAGGGRSPNTLAALRALMVAMEKDNQERPIETPNANVTGAEPVGGASGGRSCSATTVGDENDL